MLRRKPTRQELDQSDIDELDRLRRELREAAVTAAALHNSINAPVIDRTAREVAIQGMSATDRIGVAPREKPSAGGRESDVEGRGTTTQE